MVIIFKGQDMAVFLDAFPELGSMSPAVAAELFHPGYRMHSSE